MNQLDVYYRALLNYRKLTTANHDCTAMRSAIASADAEKDKIVIKRAFCTIESDWVEAIENGLIHIEKAIKQERQFIRSNGEVVPIEKVKRVSKERKIPKSDVYRRQSFTFLPISPATPDSPR